MHKTAKKALRATAIVMMLALAVPSAAFAQAFLRGHEDLPLLAGLTQDRDSVMVFDTPQGRVVEAFAQTPEPATKVLAAYASALPQMGWSKVSAEKFVRNSEILTFEVVAKGPPTVIRILLTAD
ncbi:MAG: hypothetical protein JXQ84_09170 [Rhodospirillaceae bacterium]|nr:hypothetical protein [Rhodospirillaceae bacterium]